MAEEQTLDWNGLGVRGCTYKISQQELSSHANHYLCESARIECGRAVSVRMWPR